MYRKFITFCWMTNVVVYFLCAMAVLSGWNPTLDFIAFSAFWGASIACLAALNQDIERNHIDKDPWP